MLTRMNADSTQEDSVRSGVIYSHENGHYWITTPEDLWIKANETAVRNYLNIDRGISKKAAKGEPTAVDEAMNGIVRISNVDQVTQLAGYSKGVYSLQADESWCRDRRT
jgi:hypothetical protein